MLRIITDRTIDELNEVYELLLHYMFDYIIRVIYTKEYKDSKVVKKITAFEVYSKNNKRLTEEEEKLIRRLVEININWGGDYCEE